MTNIPLMALLRVNPSATGMLTHGHEVAMHCVKQCEKYSSFDVATTAKKLSILVVTAITGTPFAAQFVWQ